MEGCPFHQLSLEHLSNNLNLSTPRPKRTKWWVAGIGMREGRKDPWLPQAAAQLLKEMEHPVLPFPYLIAFAVRCGGKKGCWAFLARCPFSPAVIHYKSSKVWGGGEGPLHCYQDQQQVSAWALGRGGGGRRLEEPRRKRAQKAWNRAQLHVQQHPPQHTLLAGLPLPELTQSKWGITLFLLLLRRGAVRQLAQGHWCCMYAAASQRYYVNSYQNRYLKLLPSKTHEICTCEGIVQIHKNSAVRMAGGQVWQWLGVVDKEIDKLRRKQIGE